MFERKYKIENGLLVKRESGIPLPDDEPFFMLRAQDAKALPVLLAYQAIVNTMEMKKAVGVCVEDFRKFAEMNPEKMAEPTP
ncbi:hypothetical protein LCGC14_1276030 [marine sediment metagenome]|uniref:Uncharacterized protein n=1 Tax=marine sediment metagenome TaxID=412755 RepID=A0A0F9KWL5_9ZZZZ